MDSSDVEREFEQQMIHRKELREAIIQELGTPILSVLEILKKGNPEVLKSDKKLTKLFEAAKAIEKSYTLIDFKQLNMVEIENAFYEQVTQKNIDQCVVQSKESNNNMGSIEQLTFSYKNVFHFIFLFDGRCFYDQEKNEWRSSDQINVVVKYAGEGNESYESFKLGGKAEELTTDYFWESLIERHYRDYSVLDKAIKMNAELFGYKPPINPYRFGV